MPRPKKYATEAEAEAAKRMRNRARMASKRATANVAVGEPRFIAYAPTPSDVPTITPPNLQLRSDFVGIPQPILTPPATQSQETYHATPLALQPPAFFLHEEDDDVLAEQSAIAHEDYEPILDDDEPQPAQDIPAVVEDELDANVLDPLPDTMDALEVSDSEEEVVQDDGEYIVNHLAKQLRHFKGCSQEEHANNRSRHHTSHQKETRHPNCHSLEQITSMVKGTFESTTPPLPDVLTSNCIMPFTRKHPESNMRMIFEGCCRENEKPRSLCLDTEHHTCTGMPNVSYDIDSTVCFPSSLAIAKEGIFMFNTFNENLNFKRSIHFETLASQPDGVGNRGSAPVPLHLLPHYCFGTVHGADSMVLHIFFPFLRPSNYPVDNNRLSDNDLDCWFEQVVIPAREKAIANSNYLAHVLPSHRVAKLNASATAKESLAQKESAGKQRVGQHIQQRYLETMWEYMMETINEGIEEHNDCERFAKPLLVLSSKNTKLDHMETANASVPNTYEAWMNKWQRTMDERFYERDNVFVDIAKQTTGASSQTPYGDQMADAHPEVYLWRNCCLRTYRKTRIQDCHRHRKGESSQRPEVASYIFAGFANSGSMTIASQFGTRAYKRGLIYSQFYSLVKTPFDSSKVYVFQNEALENLALDPAYVKSLNYVGGARTFSPKVCEISYLHSKARANAVLTDYQSRSLGTREEHRVSLSLLQEVVARWRALDAEEDNMHQEADRETPYYTFATPVMLDFLRAQLNRHCFLFEYVYSGLGKAHSLHEALTMIIALRGLRFCYSNTVLGAETLLAKDSWTNKRGRAVEGLGMMESIKTYGFGWWLPKFNWSMTRPLPAHASRFLAGHVFLHSEYQRRWQAIRDLGDVHARFHQAKDWLTKYGIMASRRRFDLWLDYLMALIIRQFREDIAQAMVAGARRRQELQIVDPKVIAHTPFCQEEMSKLFADEILCDRPKTVGEKGLVNAGGILPDMVAPYMICGQTTVVRESWELVELLFRDKPFPSKGSSKGSAHEPKPRKGGWHHKPYRYIFKETMRMLHDLKPGWDEAFCKTLFGTILLTHWILPYATHLEFLPRSKTVSKNNQFGRMQWFSSVVSSPDCDLGDIVQRIKADEVYGKVSSFSHCQLIDAFSCYRVDVLDEPTAEQRRFVLGVRRFSTATGPQWMTGKPLELGMLTATVGKSMDELETMMAAMFTKGRSNRS